MIVGTTITSMIPRALSRSCRSAAAMGPFGSRTPSLQPATVATPIRTPISRVYRMSDPMLGQEGREQQEQVEDREHEQTGCIAALGRAASAQPEGEPNED